MKVFRRIKKITFRNFRRLYLWLKLLSINTSKYNLFPFIYDSFFEILTCKCVCVCVNFLLCCLFNLILLNTDKTKTLIFSQSLVIKKKEILN